MRINKLHTPAGFRDITPNECMAKKTLTNKIMRIFYGYGYDLTETPLLEYIEVFAQRNDSDTKPMYKFFDKEGFVLAMRPDMTPPMARLAATAFEKNDLPLRLAYDGKIYKTSGNYQGKLYEIAQAGVELMGADSAEADAEIVTLAVKATLASGITNFKINLGQVQFFKGVLEETGLDESKKERLKTKIAEKDFVGVEALVDESEINPKSAELIKSLSKLVGGREALNKAKELTENESALRALDRLAALMDIIESKGAAEYVSFDLGMVNQLDYYTGIIFRGYAYGAGYPIVGGGRYDNLVGNFGKELPAVGMSVNVNEILRALASNGDFEDVTLKKTLFAHSAEGRRKALEIAEIYRRKGMAIEESLIGDDYKQNYAYAERKGLSHMLYFKDDKNVTVVSFKDQMGGFTVETTVDELTAAQEEGENQ